MQPVVQYKGTACCSFSRQGQAGRRCSVAVHMVCTSGHTCTAFVTNNCLYGALHYRNLRRRSQPAFSSARVPGVLKSMSLAEGAVILTGRSYEEIIDTLADVAVANAAKRPSHQKYIIGIAGGPGSGKSTLATAVAETINSKGNKTPAVVVPMDGFHYRKRELDAMPNPQEAHARRGAHWTFDAKAFLSCIKQIKETGAAHVPSFDHAVGDPVEGDIAVQLEHKIVLVEGNYVLLDLHVWRDLKQYFDDTWYVDCPIDLAMQRVFIRQTSMGLDPEVSKARIRGNDQPNSVLVAATKPNARVIVPSSIPFRNTGTQEADRY